MGIPAEVSNTPCTPSKPTSSQIPETPRAKQSPRSKTQRDTIQKVLKRIRQGLSASLDHEMGQIYVAKVKDGERVKIGWSREPKARLQNIERECKIKFEETPYIYPVSFKASYCTEQIIHQVLRPWNHTLSHCPCMGKRKQKTKRPAGAKEKKKVNEHEEWYPRPINELIEVVNSICQWTIEQNPWNICATDFDCVQRTQRLAGQKKGVQIGRSPCASNGLLLEEWAAKLCRWESTQTTGSYPLGWNQLFLSTVPALESLLPAGRTKDQVPGSGSKQRKEPISPSPCYRREKPRNKPRANQSKSVSAGLRAPRPSAWAVRGYNTMNGGAESTEISSIGLGSTTYMLRESALSLFSLGGIMSYIVSLIFGLSIVLEPYKHAITLSAPDHAADNEQDADVDRRRTKGGGDYCGISRKTAFNLNDALTKRKRSQSETVSDTNLDFVQDLVLPDIRNLYIE